MRMFPDFHVHGHFFWRSSNSVFLSRGTIFYVPVAVFSFSPFWQADCTVHSPPLGTVHTRDLVALPTDSPQRSTSSMRAGNKGRPFPPQLLDIPQFYNSNHQHLVRGNAIETHSSQLWQWKTSHRPPPFGFWCKHATTPPPP